MRVQTPSRFDIVVVGGGIAGLSAALRAAELGLDVVIVEQGRDERYPCNTRFSGGIVHAGFHDLNRPVDELRAILAKVTGACGDAAQIETLAVDGRRLLAWLRGHDVRFMRVGLAEAHRWCMAPPKPIAPGLDWRGRGADVLLRTLGDRFLALGGTFRRGLRAQRLRPGADGTWTLVSNGDDGDVVLQAASVVIADGGYQADEAMFRRHIGPGFARILQRGAANSRGDGVRMAQQAGADVGGFDAFYGHLQSRDALDDPRLWPYPELDAVGAAALVVGPDARRVCDEGLGGVSIANALARLDDPAGAVLIGDSAIWDGPGRSARFPANPFLERYGGTVHRAPTLAELAARLGLDARELEATVGSYNRALTAGNLAGLVPTRTESKARAWPIVAPPFIGIPLCVGLTYSMGGIRIDGDGCVLQPGGAVIPGLYAAGSATTGLEGRSPDGYVGYVGGLVKAVFGLRAAEHAVRCRRQQAAVANAAAG